MKKIQILFSAIFLAIISLPIVFFDFKSEQNLREKRSLARFPILIEDGKFNSKFAAAAEGYINDRFGFRQAFIALNQKFEKIGNAVLITNNAIQGKDGWSFFLGGENGADFFKINLYGQEDLDKIVGNVLKRQNFCMENGIDFILLICPNKHNVYPEKYFFDRPKGLSRGRQVFEALKKAGVNVVYPLDSLLLAKQEYSVPLYFENDTHWNLLGAKIGSEELIGRIKKDFPQIDFPKIEYEMTVYENDAGGDITAFLGLSGGKRTDIGFNPKFQDGPLFDLKCDDFSLWNDFSAKCKDPKLPRAKVYCDSFFPLTINFTAPMFSLLEGKKELFPQTEKEEILNSKPDMVIFEILERNFPVLLEPF